MPCPNVPSTSSMATPRKVRARAAPDLKNNRGLTALMIAAENNDRATARELAARERMRAPERWIGFGRHILRMWAFEVVSKLNRARLTVAGLRRMKLGTIFGL